MTFRPRINLWLMTLLCSVLLVARLSGAHLHLCLDGSEPFASVHLVDEGVEAQWGPAHHDEEVSLTGDVVSKSGKIGLELPVLFTFFVMVWAALQLPRLIEPRYRPVLIASSRRVWLPPPRAPPSR